MHRENSEACPHCGVVGRHVCADTDRWTQAEKDAWRERARRADPSILFAPSTQRMAELFGHRSAR